MLLRLGLIISLVSLIAASNNDTCAERFPEFKLPRPNVQCPQNISQNISSLSSCFQFQWSLTNESVFDLHECFKEIDQVLNELNITKNNSRDSCFVYACSSLTEKENDFNLCVSEYITKEFLMRKHLNVPQSYLTICHQEDVEDCIDGFIETCVIIKQEKNHFIQTCLNLLFSLCNPLSPQDMTKCKDFIENKIDESIEEICESTTDEACDNLLKSLFSNPLQLNSLNRFNFALRGKSRKTKHIRSLLMETTEIFDFFTSNISTVSLCFDHNDAEVLMTVMDNIMNSSHVDILENLSMTDVGPQILSNLNKLNRICGRSILTKEGRVSGNFSYHGTNLDVEFHVPNENGVKNISYENKAVVTIPYSYVCGNDSINRNKSKIMERILVPREKSEKDDDNKEEDLDDRFKGCYPVSFPPGCSSIVATSITQSVNPIFPTGNRTIASVILTAEIISNETDTNKSQRYGNITLSFTLDLKLNISTDKVLCSFWDVNNSDWSQDGVITRIISDTVVECISTHLTSFAVLVDHQGVLQEDLLSDQEASSLNHIGYIGLLLSIVCLLATIILLIALRKGLDKGPLLYIHINLSLALLLAHLLLVSGIETALNINWLCSVIAGLLHYLFLCVFCWMLAEGIMLYILIVRVYGTLANKWYLLLPLGWGLPIIIVAVSAGIRPHLYGTSTTCWLSFSYGMMWSFLGPMVAIILVNSVFLVLTLYHIIHGRLHGGAEHNLERTDLVKSIIKGTIVLLPLLGITWIIGIFALNVKTSVFLWIFTILNSFQGVAILYFHVLRNDFVMNWLKTLVLCTTCKRKMGND